MRVALVNNEAVEANEVIHDLVDRSWERIRDGWRPTRGLLDYLREWHGVDSGDDVSWFLVGYYIRWAVVSPTSSLIVVDDGEAAYLGLLKPELSWLGQDSITMECLRGDIEDFFITREVAQTHPRLKHLATLACRRHPYASLDDIAVHAEVLSDVWRDTPRQYWGPPFAQDSFSLIGSLPDSSAKTVLEKIAGSTSG